MANEVNVLYRNGQAAGRATEQFSESEETVLSIEIMTGVGRRQ